MITRSDIDVPFPWDARSRQAEAGFLRLLEKKSRALSLPPETDVRRSVVNRASKILEENLSLVFDEPAQFHLLLTSSLLSAVENFEKWTNNDEALQICGDAFVENGRWIIRTAFKAGLFFSRDKFQYIVKSSGEDVVDGYGSGFKIDIETDGETRLNTIVRKCGFHEFFKQNGRPELTRLMCRWDNNWSEILDEHPVIRFQRPTTIADGDNVCDFEFRRLK